MANLKTIVFAAAIAIPLAATGNGAAHAGCFVGCTEQDRTNDLLQQQNQILEQSRQDAERDAMQQRLQFLQSQNPYRGQEYPGYPSGYGR